MPRQCAYAWPLAAVKIACLAAVLDFVAPTAATTKGVSGTTRGVANAALVAAAKASPLSLVDNGESYCDGDVTVAAWLTDLTQGQAKSISWTGGPCELANSLNPIDSGGSYCAQATITLAHPKNRQDTPEIEIYLEDPKGGRPGPAYAFRSMFDPGDGLDYERERRTFDAQWRERFPDTPPRACQDAS
jgi:hypothetical protein